MGGQSQKKSGEGGIFQLRKTDFYHYIFLTIEDLSKMCDKIKEVIVTADERIKSVVVEKGWGSDGPFIQPEYDLVVTLQNGEKIKLSIYVNLDDGSYRIPLRTHDDPHEELIYKLSDAVGAIKQK